MKYTEETFNIELKDDTLSFSGKLEKSNYDDVTNFLMEVDKNVNSGELVLDIKLLTFLNSSGIRMLATFFMKSSKKFKVHINSNITWQRVGIIPLSHIKKAGEILIIT